MVNVRPRRVAAATGGHLSHGHSRPRRSPEHPSGDLWLEAVGHAEPSFLLGEGLAQHQVGQVVFSGEGVVVGRRRLVGGLLDDARRCKPHRQVRDGRSAPRVVSGAVRHPTRLGVQHQRQAESVRLARVGRESLLFGIEQNAGMGMRASPSHRSPSRPHHFQYVQPDDARPKAT